MVPSYSESFGLVAVEAQACGTPVIAASVGGLRTAVQDGVSGILVDGHDPASYARALGELFASPGLRDRLARGAVEHASRFGWGVTVDRLLTVYAGAMSSLRGPGQLHPALPIMQRPSMPSRQLEHGGREAAACGAGVSGGGTGCVRRQDPVTVRDEPGAGGQRDRGGAGRARAGRRAPAAGQLPGPAGGPAQAGHDDLADRRARTACTWRRSSAASRTRTTPLLPVPAGAQRPDVRGALRAGPGRRRLPGRPAAAGVGAPPRRSTGSSAAC